MFEQIKLSYSYDALEPYIDALTVETHYAKHHATYTKNFNAAVEKAGFEGMTVEEILSSVDKAAPELQAALKNNGGGYYNHNLYFSVLSPEPKKVPCSLLGSKIEEAFGSFDAMKEKLSAAAAAQFGSGWAWLNASPDGSLSISASANQDNPISEGKGITPILAIDVWEHAYYLKYKNLRPEYIKNLFEIIDWKRVCENYKKATGQ